MRERSRAASCVGCHALAVVLVLSGAAPGLAQAPGAGGREPEMVGKGIVRFFPFGYVKEPTPYSLAMRGSLSPSGEVPSGYRVSVAFSREEAGDGGVFRHVAVVPTTPGTSLYGAGNVSGPLMRNGRREEGGVQGGAGTEQVWPWILAVRPDGTAFGVLGDTTFRCEVDLTTGIKFVAEGPEEGFPVIVIDRDSPQEVMQGLGELTGLAKLPPRWAMGYQQIAGVSATTTEVRALAAGFRRREIACDAIWTGSAASLDEVVKLSAELHGAGFHVVWQSQTRIHSASNGVFQEGEAGDHWVHEATPGEFRYPDFTRSATRGWWGGLQQELLARGVDGVWLDVQGAGELDAEYRGGEELPGGTGARYGGAYAMLAARATFEGLRNGAGARRAYVASDPTSLGGHRYGVSWVREAAPTWNSMENSLPRILNLGLSGQVFAGWRVDAGGADADLAARWMGVAAMLPMIGAGVEPWGLGAPFEGLCKAAIDRRYRLMPYMYTAAWEASLTGMPVARPVFFADARDAALRSEDDAFLVGGDVLVVANVKERGRRAVVTPRGIWNALSVDGEGEETPGLPRLYARGGAIVPLGPAVAHTGAAGLAALELVVSLDEEGRAEGFLYEDAGDGFWYLANEYLWTRYLAETRDGVVTVRLASSEGGMRRPERPLEVRLIVTNSEQLPATAVRAGEYRAAGKEGVNVVIDVRAVK